MTSSYSEKIAKVKNALENVFVKKTDIQDNLASTDTNKPLSANQGKVLDTNKVDKISGKSLSTNDFTNTYKTKLDNLDILLESKASNTHTHGNLQNDGSIGTSNNVNKNVITDGNGKITTEDKPTIPSASTTVPSADTTNGSYGSGTDYARANHTHPKSSLYAEATHNHTKSQITDFPSIPKVFYGTSGTSASTQTKVVTTSSDFSLESGVILFVKFSNAQDYNGTTGSELKLKINDGSSINVVLDNSGHANAFATRYVWQGGEVVGFVYIGTRFLLLDRDRATTTYYGVTKLTDSTSSTSTTTSATPNSVKTAYDLANSRENPSNKVTSWSTTTTDTNYPSEKLVKDSLDTKLESSDLVDELNDIILDLITEGQS